ncbi:hypothetical protein SLEP1_g12011 [Rubroshorea leprosula]|nr:hypothetical protein SLEP1_g12011 [Rubroshorea leprosula]
MIRDGSSDGTDTTGDGHRQITWGNLLRPIRNLMVPCWACRTLTISHCLPHNATVTGTFICPINYSRVRLALQNDPTCLPFMLVEFPLSTPAFTDLIDNGILCIMLEPVQDSGTWVMYCNGQRMGLVTRREVDEDERLLIEAMKMVTAGAGIWPEKGSVAAGEYKYLRGQFERAVGTNSEAYHLKDPSEGRGGYLSVFFLRN